MGLEVFREKWRIWVVAAAVAPFIGSDGVRCDDHTISPLDPCVSGQTFRLLIGARPSHARVVESTFKADGTYSVSNGRTGQWSFKDVAADGKSANLAWDDLKGHTGFNEVTVDESGQCFIHTNFGAENLGTIKQ